MVLFSPPESLINFPRQEQLLSKGNLVPLLEMMVFYPHSTGPGLTLTVDLFLALLAFPGPRTEWGRDLDLTESRGQGGEP